MTSITRFEDIEAWQDARVIVKDIYSVTRKGEFSRDFGLRDQVRRSGVSIMSNIAEGFERKGDKQFRQFLFIAKASAAELRSLLYVALDVGYISDGVQSEIMAQLGTVSRRIANFIKYLEKSS